MNEYKTFYEYCMKAIHYRNLEIEEGYEAGADDRMIGRVEGAAEMIALRIENEKVQAELTKKNMQNYFDNCRKEEVT